MINKKNILLSLGLAVISLVMAGCSEDGTSSSGITWDSSFSGTTEMYPVVNQSSEIKFKAESSWKASCSAKWLTFSPKSGEKGNQVITVATTSTNRTKNTRTAQLTIESGGSTKTVTIKQSGEYAVFGHTGPGTLCAHNDHYTNEQQKYRATRATETCNLFIFSCLLGAGYLKMVLLWCY